MQLTQAQYEALLALAVLLVFLLAAGIGTLAVAAGALRTIARLAQETQDRETQDRAELFRQRSADRAAQDRYSSPSAGHGSHPESRHCPGQLFPCPHEAESIVQRTPEPGTTAAAADTADKDWRRDII